MGKKSNSTVQYNRFIRKKRLLTILSAILLIPVGLYTKFYTGFGAEWVHNSLGGVIYVIFWCLIVYFLFPLGRIIRIAVGVLLVTCCLEFTQLWNTPFLAMIRSTFAGRAMIGSSFSWLDFPYYFMGAVLGSFWMWIISKV